MGFLNENIELVEVYTAQLKATSTRVATYKLYGGYVTYLTKDGDFNMTDLGGEAAVAEKGEYEIANYDSSITVAKTQFTPVCQKALCATCGAELSDGVQNYLKKPVVSTTTPTADDYESILGDWTYSVTAEEASLGTALGTLTNKGDQYMLNFLVSADSADAKKVKVTTYEASVVKGVRTTATSATVEGTFSYDETTKVRTLTFTPTSGSIFNHAIKLSEENGKYTLTVNEKTVYSDLADGSSGTVSTDEYTSELSYDAGHTEHKLSVMTHYGVKYITSTDNLGVDHTHYLACEGCDVAYIAEEITVLSDDDKFDSNGYCKTCGAPNTNHADWYDISISSTSLTSADKFWVVKDTVLKIGYSEYKAFNGKTYAMTGYTTLTNAESTAEGIKPTAKAAALVFADESITYVHAEN